MRSVARLAVGSVALLSVVGCQRGRSGQDMSTDDAGVATDGPVGGAIDFAFPPNTDFSFQPPPVTDMAVPALSCKSLDVKPADLTILVDGAHTFSQDYHAICGNLDVSQNATWTIDDPSLGVFNGTTFMTAIAASGGSMIHATIGAVTGATGVTIKPTTALVVPGTPQNAPNQFGGADDPSLAPTWVYPNDGVLIPPNLSVLEFQWLPNGNTLFEIGFAGGGLNLKVYTVCNAVANGCAYTPDQATWNLLSTVARSQTAQITIRGTSGGNVGTSATLKLSFADEDMGGGLYYWAAGPGGVYRYDFGLRGQTAEPFYTPIQAGAICVGCHALAKNGSRIVVGLNIPGPAAIQVLDVATHKLAPFPDASNFNALTSDGSRLITTEAGGLTLRDAATGTMLSANPAVPNADMPDVAFDDSAVVFARDLMVPPILPALATLSVTNGGIFTTPLLAKGFGAVKMIVPNDPNGNNYYPSYSPDGKFIAYNHAAGAGATSYDNTVAHVMMVSAAGGPAVDQAAINANEGNSWPKWAPFSHHFQGNQVFWLTFSSRRPIGLRNTATPNNPPNAQIWMVALDVNKLAQNVDASYPAFWLPFQEPSTGNHIAQWAAKVERPPCSQIDNAGCGPGEMCVNGNCQPGIQ